MLLNLYRGRCWCGAPATKHFKWNSNPGSHTCEKPLGKHRHHHSIWNLYIRSWWSWYRQEFLEQYPICVECGLEKSTDVDHVIALSLGGDMWDPGNHQALCLQCHKQKTAEDRRMLAAKRRDERDARLGHRQSSLEAFLE